MTLAESIAAILAMHEGRMLRARVALLELAEQLETCSPRGRPDLDEPSKRIREIAGELAPPTHDPNGCPNHPAAETLEVLSCVVCGAWKPSKDSPLVFIGSDGVHRAVRNSPTPPAPAPYDGPAFPFPDRRCVEQWREDDGELARCDLEEGHAGAHRYRSAFSPASAGDYGNVNELRRLADVESKKRQLETVRLLRERCAACEIEIHSIAGSPLVTCANCVVRARLSLEQFGEHSLGLASSAPTTEEGILFAAARAHRAVEKASVPDQKNAVAGEAENKAGTSPKSPPLFVQCECRETDHGARCPMAATHRIAQTSRPTLFAYYCDDCTASRVRDAERIDGSAFDHFESRLCPNHDEQAR